MISVKSIEILEHYQENNIGISLTAFFFLLIKTDFKEENRCFSTSFLNVPLGIWSFCTSSVCLDFFFMDPKKWDKKFSESFVVWNCRVLWELLQIPDVSMSSLNSPIFGNNASSHFRKLCFVHFTESLPEAMCQKQQQPTAAKILGRKLRLHLSQILLLEICINVEEKFKRALYNFSSYILEASAIQGIKMSSEWAVDISTNRYHTTDREQDMKEIMWDRQQTEAYLKRLQSNK